MAWYSRAFHLFRPNRVSRDIDREMSFHVSERADELVSQGMHPAAAAREAQRRFGHRSALHEQTRDVDMLTWLESLMSDVRQATRMSGDFFTTLGVQPAAGRLLTRADDTHGCESVAVIGHGFWQSDYAGNASAVGKTVSLSGQSFTIVGVAPQGFFGAEVGRSVQIYAPLCS
ncbi:MAG: ABC transporter permease, partial [Gemmatimonadaceae bacterium]